jgi:hypothetical protein
MGKIRFLRGKNVKNERFLYEKWEKNGENASEDGIFYLKVF